MVLDNIEVNHKSFGKGIVVASSEKYITVNFEKCQKIFVYPDVFEKFLTLADGTVPEAIVCDIENVKRKKQMIIDKKNEENIRAMTKGIVIPGKEGALSESEDEENNFKNQETDEI